MALKPRYQEQVLNDGLDESTEGLVGMGGVDQLSDGTFRREGGITKRFGFSFPESPTVGSTLATEP
jgi:hypothetical protein